MPARSRVSNRCQLHANDCSKLIALDDYHSQFFVICSTVGRATDEDNTTPIDVLLFLPTALEQFQEGPGDSPEASGILAGLCTAVGRIRHELVSRVVMVGWRSVVKG